MRGEEGFGGLAREHRPIGSIVPDTIIGILRPISRSSVADAEQRGLDVSRVLRSFDQQDIDAAFDESLRLVVEILDQTPGKLRHR